MARGGGMQQVELDDGAADVEVLPPRPPRGRGRWWLGGLVAVALLGVLGFQLVADARERSAVARLAEVPGVLAPVDETLPMVWQSDAIGDGDLWNMTTTGRALVGPTIADDGSQHLGAYDLETGRLLWSTELYGPDPVRAAAEAVYGSSPPDCRPTTDDPDPARFACLVSDGFVRYGSDSSEPVPATQTFVRVIDVADGRIVAQWPASPGSLVVLDDVAVVASYAADAAVRLDGRDLLTGDPRWVASEPAPETDVGDGMMTWPPGVQRVGDDVATASFTGRPTLYDVEGRVVTTASDDAGAGSGGEFLQEPLSGRLIFAPWAELPSRASSTVLDDDRPGFTLAGIPYLPTVDDGSAPGLLLYASVDERRDGGDGRVVLKGADIGTGDLRWKAQVQVNSQYGASPLILRGRAYVRSINGLTAVDARTGEVLWAVDSPKYSTFNAPMTDGRHLLVSVESPTDRTVQDLIALDPATGEQLWRTPLPDGVDFLYARGRALLGITTDHDGNVSRVARLG